MRRAAEQARREEMQRRQRAAELGQRCAFCGEVDMPEVVRRGNIWLHVFAYLWWIIPGIIYGMWRNRKHYIRCRKCKQILGDAPKGGAAMA